MSARNKFNSLFTLLGEGVFDEAGLVFFLLNDWYYKQGVEVDWQCEWVIKIVSW